MNMLKRYEGNALLFHQEVNGKRLSPYIPSNGLKEAVNLLMILNKRPLLLMGEPGCGKTKLAEAVAYELYKERYQEFYFEWNIKSTTKAKDGLYRYDGLRRLSDAQIPQKQNNVDNLELDAENSYIKSGVLSKAFKASKQGEPSVLLIDEIDKADLDFPNDLLTELDKLEFVIDETGEKIKAPDTMPFIFITSNGEKELPPAFLRRCIFHYIKFPEQQELMFILNSHFSETPPEYVNKAIDDFLSIRQKLDQKISLSQKKVSTSELIDWFSVIEEVIKLKDNSDLDPIEKKLLETLESWEKSKNQDIIPFYQVLLKNLESQNVLKEVIENLI